jgi:two-component system, LytTR family, sensor kinase
LIERLALKKQLIGYLISLPLGFITLLSLSWLLNPLMGYPFSMAREILAFVFFTTIGTLFYLSAKFFAEKKAFYQLSLFNREIELQQLKAQLNPHFLFNALNNIYSYTLYSNRFGNELILKLSELMRYILDTSERETVGIIDETSFIENYIAFEKERVRGRCTINFTKQIQYSDRQIAPLILFPFVENAFKYGSNTIQKTTVEIHLFDTTGSLNLIVKNNIINGDLHSTKKGLFITKRRLELLYPGKYNLLLENTDNMFTADLTILYAKDKSINNR